MLGLFLMWAGLWAGHQTKVQVVEFIDQLAEAVSIVLSLQSAANRC